MKKIILSVAALAGTVALTAAEVPKVEDKALFSGGKVTGQVKAMHILADKTNGFAPEDGSGYLVWLKYVTPDLGLKGLKVGAAFYVNGDTGLTDWEDNTKNAQGMFTDVEGKTNTLLGQAYIEYKSSMLDAKVGRQILNTPLTKIKWSLMPNFYQAAVAAVKPMKGLSFTALHIDKMAYGSRSATDFSLIGEKTGTAGVTTPAVGQGTGTREQARFLNLGSAAGVAETSGMTALNATYKIGKNLKISVWDYIAHDISNTIYADVNYKIPVMKGTKLALSAQYLNQSEEGDKLAGTMDFSMYGVKAKVGNKKWSAYLAYNSSDDSNANRSGFHNAFGADPAYTSSIFSRNAYREDVSAYKIGGHYAIMKGLKIVVSHADYGKSKTLGWGPSKLVAANDATETDIVLVYKPTKAMMLKLFNARRTSEYNESSAAEKEQNHIRAVVSYNF
ncbi:MAG: hypothetical protein ACI9TV_002089 [Sulfurimonas sp.]|jgi:hypothetical protein|uniref:OprD family outer membrane porin n=1 Tax=Sulfurimonas sp. TaxID=2022749 RepID=UPI0039E255CC